MPEVISRFLLRLPSDIKSRLEAEATTKHISLNALIVERLSDEGGSFVTAGASVPPPKPAPAKAKAEPKTKGLKPASEISLAALCVCGHTAVRHYQRTGACSSCSDRSCQGFRLT